MNAKYLVEKLGLTAHPEGGFYRETYRSELITHIDGHTKRNVSTAIYFLLSGLQKSRFHRIKSDEIWFFHQGQTVEIVSIINESVMSFRLGNDIEAGDLPQIMVPANTWFAARITSGTGYSLMSCTVAPGFDFSDFELADRQKLLMAYPHLAPRLLMYL